MLTATDIAFALGVLILFGSLTPTAIKIFLTSLIKFNDVGAIIIIAIFYNSKNIFNSFSHRGALSSCTIYS